ncbi:inner-membrane translocator [Denitrovibrio acetiphilus DSM 12809]|uniref:Inner-membrane translocator n=1 Tax=Denitrovibrio acetiphilus (strain DSM 12809 / NBRC 114555 / N2460) TaxID=522772 RepID=D4H245_DENA2|nr:ribose ABC transporter permease [Denitrovibrio acetiphilus]ADD67022.1 inner-membrane translocator [Denitrovibrio acetiphilus DSM 12809]
MKIDFKELLVRFRPLLGLIILAVIISLINPRFLSVNNILNVLRQTSINAVIAAGMTFVILTGGIDLSVGSILAICGAVSAFMIAADAGVAVTLFTTLSLGTILGVLAGIAITKGKVQPFIATLVGMTLLRGATLVFTDGKPISTGYDTAADIYAWFGTGYIFGIPVPVFLMIAVFGISYYVLKHTRFGRYVYAIGGNEEASRLSGVRVSRVKIAVYAISGLTSAVAGIILTSRLSSAQPTAGAGYELDAIAAVVLGGTSLAGGVGTVFGTLTGALIIGILNNALNLMNVSSYYQMIAKGSVILIAVLMDRKK